MVDSTAQSTVKSSNCFFGYSVLTYCSKLIGVQIEIKPLVRATYIGLAHDST